MVKRMTAQASHQASRKPERRRPELGWFGRNLRWIAFLAVFLFFGAYAGVLLWRIWPKDTYTVGASGAFGDSFGVLTALFSGLAFAGVVISLFYQRKELSDTQAQMERSQRENNFFQLFRAQMEIVAQMRTMGRLTLRRYETQSSDEEPYWNIPIESRTGVVTLYWKHDETDQSRAGRVSFRRMHAELREIFDSSELLRSPEVKAFKDPLVGRITHAYRAFSEQRLQGVAHYFQSLYWLLRFLSDEPFDDTDRVTKGRLVRAQLSPYELALIYVYCAQFDTTGLDPTPVAFRELATEFELFQALPVELVIAPALLVRFDERSFGTNAELLQIREDRGSTSLEE